MVEVASAQLPDSTVKQVQSRLSLLAPIVQNEQVEMDGKSAVRLTARGKTPIIVLPFLATVNVGKLDQIARCQIVTFTATQDPQLVARGLSGFSDDYEPCVKISAPVLTDVNGDNVTDLIFRLTTVDAIGVRRDLLDVYLVSPDLRICFSPELSNHLALHHAEKWVDKSFSEFNRILGKENNLRKPSCAS